MIYSTSFTGTKITPSEYDPTESSGAFGLYGMRRAKRKGRNPSTGSRTSRPYGLTMTFLTGFLPLQAGDALPIY